MATEVKRRRGTTVEHSTFTGAVAELTVDLTKDTVVVHDGATQGGFPLLREDFSNVPTTAPFTNISLDTAIFDTTYTETGSETQGTLYWNSDEETLSLVTNGESIELGQKVEIHVKNQTGAQIDKGEVVYASGTVGASGRILVTKMIADGTVAAKRVLGVAAENIANGADGKVIKFGKLRQINTSTFSNGDILWVSTTVAGAFQNTEPSQSAGDIALPIAYVVYSSASVGEIFIRVTPIDENEYQDYDAGLTDIAGLTPSDSNFIVGDGTNWVAESGATALASLGAQAQDPQLDDIAGLTPTDGNFIVGNGTNFVAESGNTARTSLGLGTGDSPTFSGLTVNGSITVTGNVDGRDISNDGADLDELYTTIGLSSLTSNEVDQLENIGSTTISATQWGYLGVLDQNLRTTDAVTFSTVDTGQGANELYAMNQDVQTTDAVTFATVNTGQGDNELYAMNQDVQTTDDVTFNVIDVTDKIESASGYTSGITGAGTIYDMDDGNGSFFEVDNMRVRNELRAHIFKKDIVKASNAYLFITDAAEIAETSVIVDTTDTFRVLDGDDNATFNHGDLLWAKNIDDDASLQVTGVKIEVSVQPQFVWDTSEEVWSTSTITPNSYTEFASGTVSGGIHDGKTYTEYNIYEVTSGGTLNAGDTIVRVSDGSILNDASSQYSPFIDIYDGVETWADFQDVSKTKVRLGNLEGVSNASGYGLYTQNAFLTGALVVGDLTKVGQYMEFDGSTLTVQGNIVVQGGSGIASFTDAGAFATLDTATLSLISDAGNMAGIDSITAGNATTYIGAGAITTGLIAANTIVAGNIASGTITATEIASNTITANEIDANTITASEIASNTITANEIDANTITASEIAAGTITATEINVSNLFAQEIEVTGKLKATDGSNEAIVGKLENIDINVQAAQGGVSNGDFYGFFINDNNYFGISDGDITSGNVLRVGDATNFLEFDGTNFTINTNTFDLATSTLVVDSANNKIALGASADSITIDGTEVGFIADGTGEFKAFLDANNFIRLADSSLNIKSQQFNLESSTIQLGDSIELSTSEITTTYDYSGSTLVFSGLFNNTYNYFGYLEDIDDVNPDGYVFRVGDATNFMELNTSNNVAQIKFDTFDLTSGNLRIKSVGTTYPSASANTEVTTADVTDFRIATLASGFNTNSLAISNNRWVKFQFDYSQSVPGSFTAGITVTLEVSTDNSTFTDYGLFSDTRIDFNTNYFVADNATGNRLNVVDQSDSTKTEFKFTSSQTGSCTGTITMYFYVNEKDTTTHIRFNVLDSSGVTLSGASATNIGTRDYNPVTELNPSGIFTRLTDSLILSNGNTYIDYSLIT